MNAVEAHALKVGDRVRWTWRESDPPLQGRIVAVLREGVRIVWDDGKSGIILYVDVEELFQGIVKVPKLGEQCNGSDDRTESGV